MGDPEKTGGDADEDGEVDASLHIKGDDNDDSPRMSVIKRWNSVEDLDGPRPETIPAPAVAAVAPFVVLEVDRGGVQIGEPLAGEGGFRRDRMLEGFLGNRGKVVPKSMRHMVPRGGV